jgi:hypothetical protein
MDRALRDAVEAGGEHAIDQPEAFPSNDTGVGTIANFQRLVCEIANSQLLAQALEVPDILRDVLDGVIGTAIVVIDITGAATAIHTGVWDGWVFVKAAKSVWSGVTKVQKAYNGLREKWDVFKSRQETAKRQADLKRDHPPPQGPQ